MVDRVRNSLDPIPLLEAGRRPIYIIRHGRTRWNLERRFVGKSDVPLDELGESQAEALSERLRCLPAPLIYSSRLIRAKETANRIARRHDGLEVEVHRDLAELDQGELEGRYGDCLRTEYPDFLAQWLDDPTHARVPGGETLAECRDRAWGALHELCMTPPTTRPLVVVTHKMVICSIVCRLLQLPLRHFRLIGQHNTAVNLLSHGEDGLRIHRLNDAEHLSREDRPAAL